MSRLKTPERMPSRRSLLAMGASSLAALAGCLDSTTPDTPTESDPPPGTSPPPTTSPEPTPTSTATPVSNSDCSLPDDIGGIWDDPDPGQCPPRPPEPTPCEAMIYALRLEQHRRIVRALERYDHIRDLEFSLYEITATPVDAGMLVAGELFFAGTTGEGSPIHFDDSYRVAYLVAAEGTWRSVSRTGDPAPAPRQAGTRVDCAGGTPATDS